MFRCSNGASSPEPCGFHQAMCSNSILFLHIQLPLLQQAINLHFAPLTLAAINPRTGSTLTLQEPRISFVKASRFRHFSSEEAFKNHLESFTKIVNLVSF